MDMKKLLVLLLLLYPLSAIAVTYEWTDQSGTVNFNEDLGKVPKKYRKKVKILGADEGGAPQVIDEPVKGKAKETAAPKEKNAPGGKGDAGLRGEYAIAKANVQATEDELTDLRGRLGDTSKMSRTEYLSLQNTIKQEDYRLQEQKRKLESLREAAKRAGVALEQK
jgi:hypothetical protein